MVIDCKQLEVQVITYSKSQQRSMGAENTELHTGATVGECEGEDVTWTNYCMCKVENRDRVITQMTCCCSDR